MKKRLIDMDKSQRWLSEEINKKTGIKSDERYLCKIIHGQRKSARVRDAIIEILGIGS